MDKDIYYLNKEEVAQGIVSPQDQVAKKHMENTKFKYRNWRWDILFI